jgi:hypothetical protein
MLDRFRWARHLAFVTGRVNQQWLLRNEYLAAENRILRAHLSSPAPLVGFRARYRRRRALKDVERVATPDTIVPWHQRWIAHKFDEACALLIPAALGYHRKWRNSLSAGLARTRKVKILERLFTTKPSFAQLDDER